MSRRFSLRRRHLEPVIASAAIAAVWLAIKPHTVDMAAHTFRAWLFGEEGFTLWNGLWYGGHHTPAYSLLFPPLAWLIGPWLAGALSAVAAAALFEPLARNRWGERARLGAVAFGLGTGAMLFTGRLPFSLGVAFGLGAMLALQRRHYAIAVAAAAGSGLASPVAALFLTLAALAWALGGWSRGQAVLVAVAAFLPPALLAAAFPEGGYMPFDFTTYAPIPLLAVVALIAIPREERGLRIGAVIYALATTAAFFVETPMGSNAVRLGALFGLPLFLCAVAFPREAARRALYVLVIAGLVFWQWSSAGRDFLASQNEPSAKVSYYKPLLDFLATQRPEDGRVEIPFTRSHWESSVVARHFPLARGWERQLDAGRNPLFYAGILTNFTYANWLSEHGVRYVALPDVKPDASSFRERGLIERHPPYLELVRTLPHWRIFRVKLPHPMVISQADADIRLTRLRADEVQLYARTAGRALIRVRWTPYWQIKGACVERAGDWTRVIAERPGALRMTTSFSPVRVLFRDRRCS